MLALDVGSGSGRGMLARCSADGKLSPMEEIHRFENGFVRLGGGLYWDYMRIHRGILECLRACRARGIELDCIGVDAWAQDYARIGTDGQVLGLPRCYRDSIHARHAHDFERALGVDELFLPRRTGVGGSGISSFRQLWRSRAEDAHNGVSRILFMPYLFVYLLTGQSAYDESLVSVGGLCDGETMALSEGLTELLGIRDKMPPRFQRGQIIGFTDRSVREETGYDGVPVACIEAHDTTSAVSAIPDAEEYLWISSGSYNMCGATLMGLAMSDDLLRAGYAKTPLADGRVCLMGGGGAGMFQIQRCMLTWRERGLRINYPELTDYALQHRTERVFSFEDVPDDAADMPAAIGAAVERAGYAPPESPFELYEIFCNSLARQTAERILNLERMLGRGFERAYVVGGGSRADGVNQRLAELLKREILAGLPEASAEGNALAQLDMLSLRSVGVPWRGHRETELRRFVP